MEEALPVCSVGFNGNAGRSFQRQPLFAEPERGPVPSSRGRRRLFAVDMAPLRALICISRRDDLRPFSARIRSKVPSPLRLPRGSLFAR
jgi:hypothetical protein